MIVNKRKADYMYANAILATGGSGKERNLIMDEKNNHDIIRILHKKILYAGQEKNKETPFKESSVSLYAYS